MKRIFTFVITIAAVICLTACTVPAGGSSGCRKNGLGDAFSADVSITMDRLEAAGAVKRFGEGVWEIEFSEPNTLSGVKLEFSEGNVLASYKGLSFSVPQSAVPVKAMMLGLIKAVEDNAKLDELKGEEKDGNLVVSGSLENGGYKLIVDKDGRLSGFDMPNHKLTMRFTGIKTAEITAEQMTAQTSAENTTTATATVTVVTTVSQQ